MKWDYYCSESQVYNNYDNTFRRLHGALYIYMVGSAEQERGVIRINLRENSSKRSNSRFAGKVSP